MSRRRLVAILALGVCSALPTSARAGSYHVLSCTIDGRFYPNNAWSVVATDAPQYRVDPVCSQSGDPMVMSLAPENGFGAGTLAGLIVFAPPNTVISNWTVRIHHFWYAPGYLNPDGTRQPDETTYVGLGMIPGQAVSGAGQWDPNQQAALQPDGRWYGLRQPGSAGAVDTNTIAAPLVEHKSDTAVARSINNATQLGASAGCSGIGGNCELGPDASVTEEVYGSRITITDDVPPTLTSVSTGRGLMAPGLRTGGEPITFSATDNVGVRRADIVDVTNPAAPAVVASRIEACDFTRPRPCPDVADQAVAAATPVGGHRTLVLRITDAAGNQTFGAPFGIVARGPRNGVGATDVATMIAGFPRRVKVGHRRKRHRATVLFHRHTVRFGHVAHIRGILRNSVGQPISGANIRIFVRDQVVDGRYTDRGGVFTGPDGRFRIGVPQGISRDLRLAYKTFLGDDALAAHVDLNLGVRAKITARGPHRVRPQGIARFHGRLVGRPLPPHGVVLELQAFQPGHGWRTVATTRSGKRGRYVVRHRFAAGVGRFLFRIRMRRDGGYPYALGVSRKMRVSVG